MQTQTEAALSRGIVYEDGTPAQIRQGWTMIFHLRVGTLTFAKGTTRCYWARPDSLVNQDDKLLLRPRGFSMDDVPAMARLAEQIAAKHGCSTKRVPLPSTTIVAFALVAAAA